MMQNSDGKLAETEKDIHEIRKLLDDTWWILKLMNYLSNNPIISPTP